jgi:hypothetical protein
LLRSERKTVKARLLKPVLLPFALSLVFAYSTSAPAQGAKSLDLELKGGSYVINLSDTVSGAETDAYSLYLIAGKQVSLTLGGRGTIFDVVSPEGPIEVTKRGGAMSVAQFTAPADGDYAITVKRANSDVGADDPDWAYNFGVVVSFRPEW